MSYLPTSGWMPDTDPTFTHWVPPRAETAEYHLGFAYISQCKRRCLPAAKDHHWAQLPRCPRCRA